MSSAGFARQRPQTRLLPGAQVDWGHPSARGLQALWLFNEGAGSKAHDIVAANHGDLTNMDAANAWVGSAKGGALDFDAGADEWVSIPNFAPNLSGPVRGTFFVHMPIYRRGPHESVLFSTSDGGTYCYITGGSLYVFGVLLQSLPSGSMFTNTGPWSLVFSSDGTMAGCTFYANGLQLCTVAGASLFNWPAAPRTARLGIPTALSGMDGQMSVAGFSSEPWNLRDAQAFAADPYFLAKRRSAAWWFDRIHVPLEIEGELDGGGNGWSNFPNVRYPVEIRYGISGGGPLDLVAGPGSLAYSMSNGRRHGDPLGFYSPEHVDCRPGFGIGTHVRVRWEKPGGTVRYKFYGWLEAIDPTAGEHRGLISQCVALDWMHAAAEHVANVPTQVNKRYDEVVTVLAAGVPRQPEGIDLDAGVSTFPYALGGGESNVLTEFQRLGQSELARLYLRGDGVLYGENRTGRLAPTVVATFDDDGEGGMADLSAPHERSKLVNRVKGTIHPRRVDAAATTILFTLQQVAPTSQHSVAAGDSVVIEGPYNDPAARAIRVGGTDMVSPVATTDYTMFANADGTGTNLTASFTVVASYGGDSALYTITNGSGSVGYITKLQARGRGLYDYDPVPVWVTDQTSIDDYGEASLDLDMAYLSDLPTANAIGEYIRDTWSQPGAIEAILSVEAGDDDAIDAIMAREPGDVISVRETAIGVSYAFFINYVDLHIRGRYDVGAEFVLQRAPIGAGSFFTLDSATLGQLDEEALAPL